MRPIPDLLAPADSLAVLDDRTLALAILEDVLSRPPLPLRVVAARATPTPASYLLSYHGPLEVYTPLATTGWPMYAGSSNDIADRCRRHIVSLQLVRDLAPDDFGVVLLPSQTHAAAMYAESCLIEACCPVWNQRWLRGFGSKSTGRGRSGQRLSPWDQFHLGRRPQRADDTICDELARRVERYLTGPGAPLAAWTTTPFGVTQLG